jgi:hypothetical protein
MDGVGDGGFSELGAADGVGSDLHRRLMSWPKNRGEARTVVAEELGDSLHRSDVLH